MKNMIITLTLLFFTYGYTHAQSYASARIIETQHGNSSRIIVVYEDGKSEVIELNTFQDSRPDRSNELIIENHIIINNFFNKMAVSGYEIVEMTKLGRVSPPTFVLFKKE